MGFPGACLSRGYVPIFLFRLAHSLRYIGSDFIGFFRLSVHTTDASDYGHGSYSYLRLDRQVAVSSVMA